MSDNKNHPLQRINNSNQSNLLKRFEQVSGKPLAKGSEQSILSQNLDVVFIFDATGSMTPYINEVKRNLQEIIQEIKNSIPTSLISVIAYADYPHLSAAFLTKVLNLTNDTQLIKNFISEIYTTGNDDIPEAVEVALSDATKLNWRIISKKAVIVVGDAPPHGVTDAMIQQKDYKIEANKLIQKQVKIYTVQCGFDKATEQSFKWLADKSAGIFLNLSNIDDLKNILIGASMKEVGLLDNYINKLNDNKTLTESKRNILKQLNGK
ncbi:MAG: vWA domain-containing protein [Paludibacter sp.]